jgi:hypothetical protein
MDGVGQTTTDVLLQVKAIADANVTPTFDKIGRAAYGANAKVKALGGGLTKDLKAADRSVSGLSHSLLGLGVVLGGTHEKFSRVIGVALGAHAVLGVWRSLNMAIALTSKHLGSVAAGTNAVTALSGGAGEAAAAGGNGLLGGIAKRLRMPLGSVGGALGTLGAPISAAAVTVIATRAVLLSTYLQEWLGGHVARGEEALGKPILPQGGVGGWVNAVADWRAGDAAALIARAEENKKRKAQGLPPIGREEWERVKGQKDGFEQLEKGVAARERKLEENIRRETQHGLEAPFFEKQRALAETAAGMADQARILRNFGQDQRNQKAIELRRQYKDALAMPAGLDKLLEHGGTAYLTEQHERSQDLAKQSAEKILEAENKQLLVKEELKRATAEQNQLAKDLADWEQVGVHYDADTIALKQTLLDSCQRLLEVQQRYNDAVREEGQARLHEMGAFKEFARDQERHFRSIRYQEAERRKDLFRDYGLMDPSRRQATMNLAQKLAGGPPAGGGRGPRWRMGPGGKWIMDPGTVGGLTQQGLQFAQSNPFLQEKLKDYANKLAGQDKAGFERLMQLSGIDTKRQQAEQAERYFADIKLQVEQKIDAQIKLDEGALADQLAKQLLQPIVQMEQQIKDLMSLRLKLEADKMQAAAARKNG